MLMAAQQAAAPVIPDNTPFVRVDKAETLLAEISGREYYKAYDGEAWVAIIIDAQTRHYMAPTLIAHTAEACIRQPNINYPPVHVRMYGQDWWWCWHDWAMPTDGWELAADALWQNPLQLPIIGPKDTYYFDTLADGGVLAAKQLVNMLLGKEPMEIQIPYGS